MHVSDRLRRNLKRTKRLVADRKKPSDVGEKLALASQIFFSASLILVSTSQTIVSLDQMLARETFASKVLVATSRISAILKTTLARTRHTAPAPASAPAPPAAEEPTFATMTFPSSAAAIRHLTTLPVTTPQYYYALLGLSLTSHCNHSSAIRRKQYATISNKDITKAYRKLALMVHPDKNGDGDRKEQAEVAFKVLGKAYEGRRARYDRDGKL